MILYGNPVAEKIYLSIEKDIKKLTFKPFLAVILVGEDRASCTYVKVKEKKATKLGLGFQLYHFSGLSRQNQILDLIDELNNQNSVSGVVVQLPLPAGFDAERILHSINPKKDIDGLSSKNPPPTATAILEILKFYSIDYLKKTIVLAGHGKLVGEPLEKILKAEGVDPIVCDSKTANLKSITLRADILVSATGMPDLIKADMVRPDTVVIDAGTAESNGKMAGDVSEEVYGKVQSYSPMPGGVGPVTVACLMKNLAEAAKKS